MSRAVLVSDQQPPLHQFNSNELAIVRLGENPEEFDHYIFGALEQI